MGGDTLWYWAGGMSFFVFLVGVFLPSDKPKRKKGRRPGLVKPYTY